jgi:hypothetical protein
MSAWRTCSKMIEACTVAATAPGRRRIRLTL